MVGELEALGARVSGALPGAVTDVKVAYGELTLTIARDRWVDVVTYLRDDAECLFVNIIDVTAADYPERDERFEVVAHFQSPKHNRRIRIKTPAAEDTPVASLVGALSRRRLVRARDL